MSILQTPGAPPPAPAPPRHALGLPAGSVRAILAFAVLAMLWVIALRPLIRGQALAEFQLPVEFVYLQIVMVLILAHFFAAHGGSIGPHTGGRSPLGLPRGSVRFLLLAGYLGLAVYLFRTQPKYEVPGQRAIVDFRRGQWRGRGIGRVGFGIGRRVPVEALVGEVAADPP